MRLIIQEGLQQALFNLSSQLGSALPKLEVKVVDYRGNNPLLLYSPLPCLLAVVLRVSPQEAAIQIKQAFVPHEAICDIETLSHGGLKFEISSLYLTNQIGKLLAQSSELYLLDKMSILLHPSLSLLDDIAQCLHRTLGILEGMSQQGLHIDEDVGIKNLLQLPMPLEYQLMMSLDTAERYYSKYQKLDQNLGKKLAKDVQNYYNAVALSVMPIELQSARFCLLKAVVRVLLDYVNENQNGKRLQ